METAAGPAETAWLATSKAQLLQDASDALLDAGDNSSLAQGITVMAADVQCKQSCHAYPA